MDFQGPAKGLFGLGVTSEPFLYLAEESEAVAMSPPGFPSLAGLLPFAIEQLGRPLERRPGFFKFPMIAGNVEQTDPQEVVNARVLPSMAQGRFLVLLHVWPVPDGPEEVALDLHPVKRAQEGVAFRVGRRQLQQGLEGVNRGVHAFRHGFLVRAGAPPGAEAEHVMELGHAEPVKRPGSVGAGGGGGKAQHDLCFGKGFGIPRLVGLLEQDHAVEQRIRCGLLSHQRGNQSQTDDGKQTSHVLTESSAARSLFQAAMSKSRAEIPQRQRAFFDAGKTRSVAFRLERLRALQSALEAHEAELLEALHADLRKSPTEAYVTELAYLHAEIRHALRHLKSWMKPQRRSTPPLTWPSRAWTQPEPLGVALILGPWNYPVQLLLTPLVGAIAAGNCAVLKPSEHAPATAEVLERLVERTFAPEHVTLIRGGPDTAEALLRERFDKIFFTGGATIGRKVMAAAAHHLTPVTLELGGKSPCIVCADAPPRIAARRIVWGKFLNAGQTCVAPDHVWADHRIMPFLLEEMVRAVRDFYGEDPSKSPDYARIVNRAHFDRLCEYLRQGHIVIGGQHNREELYIAPTVLTGTSPESPVMQDEIFGPILPVLSFQSLEQVVIELRRRPSPLALYLFTRDRAIQQRLLSETRSGGVCLNDTVLHLTVRDLPFGGVGASGFGTYHGRAGFECFSHQRAVLQRRFAFDSRRRYPPCRLSLATLKRVMRWLLSV